jgi:hypothetical protein
MDPEEPQGKRLGRQVNYLGQIRDRLQDLTGYDTLAHELIQNAEDAKATQLVFDVRDDALIVENNATFLRCPDIEADRCPWKDEGRPSCDWHNLREIAGGQKRDREDAIGKFGVGFTAVYQLTDRPEIISELHWALEEEKPERERIYWCPGTDGCRDVPDTRFVLPYARDPRSTLRTALAAPPVTDDDVPRLVDALTAAAPASLLFMSLLRSVEIRRNGTTTSKTTADLAEGAHGFQELTITTDGEASRWYLLSGGFEDEAETLRATFSQELIEDHRASTVTVAVPVDGSVSGRLYAGLPTDNVTRLPFHIDARFFPSTDRKRVLLGSPS